MIHLPPYGKTTYAWNRRLDRIRAVDERNQAWAEMDAEGLEWGDKLHAAGANHWPRPVGGGLIKAKFEIAAGLRGLESGWDIDTVPVADFGNINLAGAGTIRTVCSSYPTFNPVHGATAWMDVPDMEPFELSTLAGANGARVAGTSTNPLAILGAVYIIHITSAAAVYQPANTTINVRAISTTGATGGAFSTLASIASAALATNFVDSMTIAAPSERQVAANGGPNPIGTLLATVAALFNGDTNFVELVTTAALNVQGNILAAEMEII